MREGGKGKVEVVLDLRVLESLRLRERGPDLGQILDQGVPQVFQRGIPYVVANDEEEE